MIAWECPACWCEGLLQTGRLSVAGMQPSKPSSPDSASAAQHAFMIASALGLSFYPQSGLPGLVWKLSPLI